jgi:putative addiction module killer protein
MAARFKRRHDAPPLGTPTGKGASGQPERCEIGGREVFEMREHFGPGWRMYYVQRGSVLIVMLGGGDKSTQTSDIAKAVQLATTLEE